MPPQKRRGGFESDDDSDDVQEGPSSAHSSGGRKRRRVSDESAERSDASDQEDAAHASTPPSDFDTDDEEGLVNAASQAARKRYARQGDISNEPAQHGILEKVELVNFMCHQHYEYKLGPLINFICGKNGSGKSAILTAIVLCLGGKAAATNRGSSLKDFIREGTDHARIICYIKNQGEAAYQPELYGDTIQVERHFSRTGPSGFKIKNANGKVITTKRADLEDICDHFTLQIENPLNVLSQDQARQFITSSSPSEKYKFFVKGVLLEQLDQDYRLIEEQLDNIQPKIDAAAPDIQVLEQKWQVADGRLKASQKHDTWRARLNELRRLCLWVQVEEQEQLLADAETKVANQLETVTEAEKRFDAYREETVEESTRLAAAAKEALETATDELKTVADNKAEAEEPKQRIKGEMQDAIIDLRNVKGSLSASAKLIEKKKEEILAEEQRLAELDGGGAARRHRELEEAREAVKGAKKAQDDHVDLKANLQKDLEAATDSERKTEDARRQKVQDVERQSERLVETKKRQQVQDNVFHPSMPQILKDIQKETRFQQRPIGPIGKHVKLLVPEWSSILEKAFGGTLNGFIVLGKQDEAILSSITKKYRGPRMPNIPIFLGNNRNLDTTGKEPDAGFKTIMRALEIDNEHVRKVLVIAHNIENTGLIQDQAEASQVLFQDRPKNMPRCFTFHPRDKSRGIFLSFRGGRPAQDPIDQWQGKTRMKTNIEAQIDIQEGIVRDTKLELRELEEAHRAVQNHRVKANQALERHRRGAQDLKVAFQQSEDKVEGLVDAINEDNTRVGSLEVLREALHKAELDKETNENLYMEAQNNRDAKGEALKEATRVLNEIDSRLAELREAESAAKTVAQKADTKQVKDLREANRLEEEKKQAARDLEDLEKKKDTQKELIGEWTQQAQESSARVNIPEGETRKSLDEKYESLKKRLQEAQKKTGDPKVVEAAAADALEAYSKAKQDLQSLEELQEALKDSLLDRKRRWKHFRGHISAAARSQFTYFLSERGFRGEVVLDHRQKMLDISVEPDITRRDGGGRSARTLSGGEKSFSQICLLLSIWEAMGSPIRCLDEFDVFMDAVNRTTSVSLLIEAARQSPGKQYILISPGTKSDIKKAPDVQTIEIAPPERGQTRLDFAAAS